MKHFFTLVWAIILFSAFLVIGRAEQAVDFDLSACNRGITYAQMIQVCNAPQDYDGKIFRVKGKFNYAEKQGLARIIFSDNAGCCELAMLFYPAEARSYPDEYTQLYSDIMITAQLVVDLNKPDMPCWFTDAAIE